MAIKEVAPKKRSSVGISPDEHLALSRLCLTIREKGGRGVKHMVIGKMIEYFAVHPETVKHIVV